MNNNNYPIITLFSANRSTKDRYSYNPSKQKNFNRTAIISLEQ